MGKEWLNDREVQARQDEERKVRRKEPTDLFAIERLLLREDEKCYQQRKNLEPLDVTEKDDSNTSSLRRHKIERKDLSDLNSTRIMVIH